MIERFYLKDYISFDEVDLEFKNGLILFSGASGVGKSILLNALLGVFALKDIDASLAEVSLDNTLEAEKFGIENEEINVFRFVKTKSARYFVNGSQLSKKSVKEISKNFIDYLSLREYKEFENSIILEVLDSLILKSDDSYSQFLSDFREDFLKLQKLKRELNKIEDEESRVEELKEFALFEIEKIESVAPKEGEYEELLEIKRALSKKEKILESINRAEAVFEVEHFVQEALELLEVESTFFDESLNELRVYFENAKERMDELDEVDIEEVLDRIEKLSSLIQRYGSIKDALSHLEKRKEELEHYNSLSFEKEKLVKDIKELEERCQLKAKQISQKREKALKELNRRINEYLGKLYLKDISLGLKQKELGTDGLDEVDIELWGVKLEKISSGEFNRVRLAFLSSYSDIASQQKGGILILDEVDANLSGKESMSIANVLTKLAKNYQIFAISHQPQLTSKADMHFLVYKEGETSKVKELKTKDEKIKELARMISGEKIHQKAVDFAKSLYEN